MSRISALTRSGPEDLGPGSKERKRVLLNLARGFHLSANPQSTKPALGQSIAHGLGVDWDTTCWSAGDTITLVGLNRLLDGAERLAARVHYDWTSVTFALENLAGHPDFVPATNKLEVVNRIAALTSSPAESLGPGSKEKKSVLINLASGLALDVDPHRPKPELGGQIARILEVPWDPRCWSRGSTLTLDGLNRLLFGAELASARWDRNWSGPPSVEAGALLEVLATVVHGRWDGRRCIEEMRLAEDPHWAQDEWTGFYFEFVGLPALINTFGGGPVRFVNTVFDYSLRRVWDLKTHSTSAGSVLILNDRAAVLDVLSSQRGLGFLVLNVSVEFDDEFREWHRQYRVDHGRVRRVRSTPARFHRRSKSYVSPQRLEAFVIPDYNHFARAEQDRRIRLMNQGRQSDGGARRPKSLLALVPASSSDLLVATRSIDQASEPV